MEEGLQAEQRFVGQRAAAARSVAIDLRLGSLQQASLQAL